MGNLSDSLLREFKEEASTTKRVLERVPENKLPWKPHAKSMALGQLAWHVAAVPGNLARLTQQDSFDVSQARSCLRFPRASRKF
jgi:DinB family.